MFTIEELTLIQDLYSKQPNKSYILKCLNNALENQQFNTCEAIEVKELLYSTIRKLSALTDDNFKSIDFTYAIKEEGI